MSQKFNAIRERINDNPNADNFDIEKLPKGIDKDEYILLLYFIPDPNILTIDDMKQLYQVIQKTSFVDKVKNVKGIRKYFMVILMLSIGFAATILTKDKKKVLLGMTSWLLGLIILTIIAMDGTVKYRVFICYLITMMWILYWLVKDVAKFNIIAALILIPSLLISMKYAIHNVRIRESNKSYVSKEFVGLQCSLLENYQRNKGNADCKIFDWNFSVACLNPMKIMDSKINLFGSGWLTDMPFNNSLKSHLDLLKDDVVIFTLKEESSGCLIKLNKLQNCIYRNYGVATKTEVVCENDKYEMVQIIADSDADE